MSFKLILTNTYMYIQRMKVQQTKDESSKGGRKKTLRFRGHVPISGGGGLTPP